MAEKLLFQIAIERILDRLSKLEGAPRTYAQTLLINAATREIRSKEVCEQAAFELSKTLFPELYR